MIRFCGTVCAILGVALLLIGCSKTLEEKLDDHVKKGQELLAEGKLTEAEGEFKEALLLDSTKAQGLFGHGLILEYRGFYPEAAYSHLIVARMNDGYPPAMRAYTRLAIRIGDLENARKMAQILIDRFPDDPQPEFWMARIEIGNKSLELAHEHITRAKEKGADPVRAALYEADINFRSQDRALTISSLKKLSGLNVSNTDDLQMLAGLYSFLNMGDSAIFYQRRAVKKDPDNIYRRIQLAQYLFDDRFYYEAKKIVDDLVVSTEQFGQALMLDAYIKYALGDNTGAQTIIYDMVNWDNSRASVFERVGDFHEYFDERKLAANSYESAYLTAVKFKYPEQYIFHAFVRTENTLLDINELKRALENLTEEQRYRPRNLELKFFSAELGFRMGEGRDSARILVDDQVRQYYDDPEWLALAAKYFWRTNRRDSAFEIYSRLIELPNARESYYHDMLTYLESKADTSRARRLFQLLPVAYQNSTDLFHQMHDVYIGAGDTAEACHYMDMLNARSPEYIPYLTAKGDCLIRDNEPDSAERLLGSFVREHEKVVPGYVAFARLLLKLDKADSARAVARAALAVDSGSGAAYELVGEFFRSTGQMDSAFTYYRKAIDRRVASPWAYYYICRNFLEKRDSLNRAEGLAMYAHRYFNGDRRGFLLLGDVYEAVNKYQIAETYLRRGLRLHPRDGEFAYRLGRNLIRQNKEPKEARQQLENALKFGLSDELALEAKKLLRSI